MYIGGKTLVCVCVRVRVCFAHRTLIAHLSPALTPYIFTNAYEMPSFDKKILGGAYRPSLCTLYVLPHHSFLSLLLVLKNACLYTEHRVT